MRFLRNLFLFLLIVGLLAGGTLVVLYKEFPVLYGKLQSQMSFLPAVQTANPQQAAAPKVTPAPPEAAQPETVPDPSPLEDLGVPEVAGEPVATPEPEPVASVPAASVAGPAAPAGEPTQQLARNTARVDYLMSQAAQLMVTKERVDEGLAEMREGKAVAQALEKRIYALESANTVLLNRVKELEAQLVSLQQRGYTSVVEEPLPIQHDATLTGGTRYPMSPERAQRFLQSIRNIVPTRVDVRPSNIDLREVYEDLGKTLTQVNFLTHFVRLSEMGYDVHFVIGLPNPDKRPVWLEVYKNGAFSIIHPELDYQSFNKLLSREDLPAVYANPAFGLTYDGDGNLTFYEIRKQ